MTISLIRHNRVHRLLLGSALCLASPLARLAAQTPPAVPANAGASADQTSPPAPTPQSTGPVAPSEDQTLVLNPFTVTTDRDQGYAATNEISGSRVNTPLKDIPVPIDVITSEFISDIGATDLRSSLEYSSEIMLQTQNDLENTGATYGSAYGPGGVNNPQGLTSNIDSSQIKIRGFVTTNVLRDGFLRAAQTDTVNLDRVEVVYGPNALLYGTGNFGGVVDYLTKQPQDQQAGGVVLSYGTYDFGRVALDTTGPLIASQHLDYRLSASWETADTNIDFQKSSHFFIAPVISWRPTDTTTVTIDTEYENAKQNGFAFQAFRASEGNGSTGINNDQLEATAFYYPPGANPRTINLAGPDTYDNQQESNFEAKIEQILVKGHDFVPEISALLGYNHSETAFQQQVPNGQIFGPIAAGQPGYDLSGTVDITTANNLGGEPVGNLNLQTGTFPNSVVEYTWNQNDQEAMRNQERAELTAHESIFTDHWYHFDDQVLGGFTSLYNQIQSGNWETVPGDLDYASPLTTNPVRFAYQGDGAPSAPMYQNDRNNINKGWDSAFYLNNYGKLFNGWVVLMDGIRRDRMDNWSTDTSISAPTAAALGGTPTVTSGWANVEDSKSYQNGVMLQLVPNHLYVYGLKAEGFEPNFGGLHNGVSGGPVGANYAKSREEGIKFDFFDGKLSGRISHYVITKTSWVAEPWYAPAPLGHPRFNPNADIVYELSGGGGGFNAIGETATNGVKALTPAGVTGVTSAGGPVWTDPTVVADWNAAVQAGAIYSIANEPGKVYVDASKPTGAAMMDAAFAANQEYSPTGEWPGWLFQGDSVQDPNINNATEDAAGFYNTSQDAAWQVIDQSRGWDGDIIVTPTKWLQVVFNATIDATVRRLDPGEWPQYPYPQDRWAVWYFQNGSFGLDGEPLNVAYTNPQNTATRTTAGVYPGDDSPRYAFSTFVNLNADRYVHGLDFGIGGTWHSQEEYFSGVTHGSGQIEVNTAGLPIVVWSPSQFLLNLMVKYTFKSYGHPQYVQLNVDNALNDTKEYGLIYQSPLMAKVSYGIGF
jgi:outer membrane receptor protein involved in Fe transport